MNTSTVISSITRRKMLGGFAVGAGAVLAAACGAAPAAAPVEEMAKEEGAETAAPVAEDVSILYLTYVRPARNEAEAALYGAFEEANPNIKLDLKIIDGGGQGVRQNIPILFAAGTPVGLFENTWGTWLQFVEGDLIVPAWAADGPRWCQSLRDLHRRGRGLRLPPGPDLGLPGQHVCGLVCLQ